MVFFTYMFIYLWRISPKRPVRQPNFAGIP